MDETEQTNLCENCLLYQEGAAECELCDRQDDGIID